jgi:hypothetical protein
VSATSSSTLPKLREILVRVVRIGDLLKALIIIGPIGAAYFVSGERTSGGVVVFRHPDFAHASLQEFDLRGPQNGSLATRRECAEHGSSLRFDKSSNRKLNI